MLFLKAMQTVCVTGFFAEPVLFQRLMGFTINIVPSLVKGIA